MQIVKKDCKKSNHNYTESTLNPDSEEKLPETYVNDFMQEINDYIINGLHYGLFASKKFTGNDAKLYKKIR